MASDAKALIETAVDRTVAEVPALANLKLVVGLEFRGGRDVQMFRLELPGPKVTKDIAADARVRLYMPRAAFNELATKGNVKAWRRAFATGEAKAEGNEQILRLIAQVIERQEERSRTKKVHR